MRRIVAEESVTRLIAAPAPERLVTVPRPRGRGRRGWAPLHADGVIDALDLAGPGAVVLARGCAADPGAALLPSLGRTMGHDVVRLPDDSAAAAWALGVALHPDFPCDPAISRLEALVGVASSGGPLPRRAIGAGGPSVPALRPEVLSRWAGCAWRACARCSGGGPVGGSCGRCGAAGIGAART